MKSSEPLLFRQVLLEDGTVLQVAFDKLTRCFKAGQLVEVYMGRQFGWAACSHSGDSLSLFEVYGTVAHTVLEHFAAEAPECQVGSSFVPMRCS